MSKKNSNVLNLKSIFKETKLLNLYSIFKSKLEKSLGKNSFIVAVSGGPDSLALSAFSKIYKSEKKNKVFFVLIDHGIRKNSNKEAYYVKKILKKKGINLSILTNKKEIKNNVQSKARVARYRLIEKFCKKKRIKFVLTGHHSDDQIETFFIRLSRGSGIQGLSSMNKISQLSKDIKIFRPFLEFKKKELLFISKKIFKKIINDPSNKNKKFLRVKVRHLKKELEKSGIHHDQIIKSINNLASTKNTLNIYLKKAINSCVKKNKKETIINLKQLLLEPEELRLKVLGLTIKNFSKSYYPPRSKKVLNILNRLKKGKKFKATLGGCLFEKKGNNLFIRKEI